MTSNNQRLEWLDGLRAIASIAVVFFHLNEPLLSSEPLSVYRSLAKLGWAGVPIFFFISGYCIKMVTLKSNSAVVFWQRRFRRIFPAYYFSLMIVLFAVLVRYFTVGHNDVTVLPRNLVELVATVSLMTSPATNVPTINWVYWSLTYEVCFYVVIGFSLLVSDRYRDVVIIGITVLSCLHPFLKLDFLFFLNQWAGFALGYFIYAYQSTINWRISIIGIISCICSLALNYHELSDKNSLVYLLALGSVAIFSLVVSSKTINFPKLLNTIGLSSYSLYLIHVPIGVYLLARWRNSYILEHSILHFFVDSIIVIVLILLARLMYRYIEEPFQRFGKNWLKTR